MNEYSGSGRGTYPPGLEARDPYGMPDYPPTGRPVKRRTPTRGKRSLKSVVMMAVSGMVGALLVLLVMPAVFGVNPCDLVTGKVGRTGETVKNAPAANVTNVVSASQGATDVATVARKVTPSIVNIDIKTASQGNLMFQMESQEGTGSGIIYGADGYIITNNHVVENASEMTVSLANGSELKARKIGTDPSNDIAVIKIDKTGLPAASIGDSDGLVVGQLVVAVGSPLGFEQTVTAGIISALHRNISADNESGQATVLTDLIQTDASINPGNSGGALCDGNGALIGMNTLIASQSGGSEGIGFAIPVDTLKRVADALIAGKAVSHPYIGVQGQTVTSDIAQRYGLPVSEGAYLTRVTQGSPAEKAGLKTGDIIVETDGQPAKSVDDLIASIRKKSVGDTISVTFYEGSSEKTVKVNVQEEPRSTNQ